MNAIKNVIWVRLIYYTVFLAWIKHSMGILFALIKNVLTLCHCLLLLCVEVLHRLHGVHQILVAIKVVHVSHVASLHLCLRHWLYNLLLSWLNHTCLLKLHHIWGSWILLILLLLLHKYLLLCQLLLLLLLLHKILLILALTMLSPFLVKLFFTLWCGLSPCIFHVWLSLPQR